MTACEQSSPESIWTQEYNLEGHIIMNFVIYTGDAVLLGKRNQGGSIGENVLRTVEININSGTSWRSVT
jgi:hypothetical protein